MSCLELEVQYFQFYRGRIESYVITCSIGSEFYRKSIEINLKVKFLQYLVLVLSVLCSSSAGKKMCTVNISSCQCDDKGSRPLVIMLCLRRLIKLGELCGVVSHCCVYGGPEVKKYA